MVFLLNFYHKIVISASGYFARDYYLFRLFTGLLTMLLLVFSGVSNLCEEGWNGYR